MQIIGSISKIIPEGNFKDILRLPVYWIFNNLKFIKRKIKLFEDVYGYFFFLPFNHLFNNKEIKGYFFKYTPKKGDIVIDVGAYVGHFTVVASKLVGPTGKVIAIEPDKFNFNQLKRTIKLNNLKNVKLLNIALNDVQKIRNWSVGGVESQFGDSKIFKVKTIPLDKLTQDIKQINFIKMDIEGAEIKALNGAKLTLQKTENLAIASYHIVNHKRTFYEVEKILKENNFKVFTSDKGQLVTFASK